MKKFKLFTGIFSMALLLTGCATVSDVVTKDGNSVYYDDIVYGQGQVVKVEDYLYYGNGYFDSSEKDFNYAQSAQKGYLARLNISDELNFDKSVKEEYKTSTSPNGILKVNQKLAGYQNQYMFALGSYLYFTSANTHQNSSLENDYTQVSLFRVKFNGDGFQEFGTYRHDASSIITAQKGSDNNYYMIISEPAEKSTYNVYSIKIGDELGKAKQLNAYSHDGKNLTDKIQTMVVCDSGSAIKDIVYTIKSTQTEIDTTQIKSVDFATGEITSLDSGVSGSETKLMGRVGDNIFYSYKNNGINEVYFKNIQNGGASFSPNASNKFYNATEIKNIKAVGEGYAFVAGKSGSLMYKTLDVGEDAVLLATSNEFSDVLFTDSGFVYVSNATSISRIDARNGAKQEIVSTSSIISGQVGYDGDYIYFYSKLIEVDEEKDTEDDNYYLYRTDKLGNYQLLGQTK